MADFYADLEKVEAVERGQEVMILKDRQRLQAEVDMDALRNLKAEHGQSATDQY